MSTTRRALLAGVPGIVSLAQAQTRDSEPLLRLPKKVRVAMNGLEGHQTEVLTPSRRIPEIEIAAYFDKTPRLMESFARSYPDAKPYHDARRMLDEVKPDIVCINNWHSERAQAIVDCMERGIHVVSEKPIATEWRDLARVKEAVERGPAKLTAELPMRFTPMYMALKQIVDAGELGEVIQIDSQKSYQASERLPWWFKRETYGGTIPWIGTHMVDLMLYTTGLDFEEVFSYQNHIGFPETGETENITDSLFKLSNGGIAVLRMDYLRPQGSRTHGDDRLRLAGTKGVAEYMEATGVTLLRGGKDEKITDLPPAGNLFLDFLNYVYLGKQRTLTWEHVYRGTQVTLAARDAAEQHRIVKIDRA